MSDINRVTAYLKVTAEFYDPEATPETVRACVEQDLEDAGYEVEVDSHECGDDRDYRKDYLDFVNFVTDGELDHVVPFEIAKSRYMGSRMQKLPLKNRRKDILQELVWYREGLIQTMQPEYVDALITAIMGSERMQPWNWIPVKDRLPEAAGYACLVTAVNRFGQKDVFEAFTGYGDFKWYTYDVTKMKDHRSADNSVSDAWTITHWMEKPEPAEE